MAEKSARRAGCTRGRGVGGKVGEDFGAQTAFQLNLKGRIKSSMIWRLWAGWEIQMEGRVRQDLENADPGEVVPDLVSVTIGVWWGVEA